MTANKPISHQRSAAPRERLRLRDVIRRRLVACGWCKQVQILCVEILKENEGRNVSLDTLITKVLPHAREMVPLSFNQELQEELRTTELAEDYEDEEEDLIIINIPRLGLGNFYRQENVVNQEENASNPPENAANPPENAANPPENASNQQGNP